MADPKVTWEWHDGLMWEGCTVQETREFSPDLGIPPFRASYDGGEPRSPAEWLDLMKSEAIDNSGPEECWDSDWDAFDQAYAVLKDLLNGGGE